MENNAKSADDSNTKSKELKAMGFITIVLFPILGATFIGAYSFVNWLIQTFSGVVGH
ncbi:nitrate reductase [Shewanella marina]|uniref:nitrate reductase n=1 Tax=Shewanella marina TaxID=487319 RepID=UPI00046E603E|nr:nitrate reductase [Shewanella marina]